MLTKSLAYRRPCGGRCHRPRALDRLAVLVAAMAVSALAWGFPSASGAQQHKGMSGHGSMQHEGMAHQPMSPGAMKHGEGHPPEMAPGHMEHGAQPHSEMKPSGMMHGPKEQAEMQHGSMEHGGMAMHRAVVWADPSIVLSPPPPLMGRQMGQVVAPGVPPLGYEMDGDVKVFRIVAQPVKIFLNDGRPKDYEIVRSINRYTGAMVHPINQPVRAWGYNGTSPGPTIEVTEGDRIRIILKKELPEPTSIHWHSIELPNEMDGAAGQTEQPTMPGETRVYEFTLYQSGTFMYHTGFNVMKQDSLGLGGFLVVHPKKPKHKIDKDFTIMLQAWALLPGNENPNLVTMDFNWFTFNGRAAPDIPVLTIKQGERVRIRIANLSMDSHPIHIHGYAWKVVGTEGGPIPEGAQWSGTTINVAPGTTRDVEFVAWNPGVWRFHCHKLHHLVNAHADVPMGVMSHGGMFTLIHVIPNDPGAAWKHPKQER